MTADELRPLAARLEEHADLHGDLANHDTEQAQWERDLRSAAAYLRACADALDAGPVAWRNEVRGDGTHGVAASEWRHYNTTSWRDAADRHLLTGGAGIEARAVPLYPLAMPAQAQTLRLPEPMTDDALNKVSSRLRDDLLDHIYEHTTLSEGILPMVLALCRAIEAETLCRVKEANK